MKKQQGFSLMELMIVVVAIAVLATIAIPTYRDYVIRSHRRAAQSVMMDIATREQQFFVANRTYASTSELEYSLSPEVDENYEFDIDVDAGPPPSFEITFTPEGGQAGDGDLTLDSNGVKSPAAKWTK
jgi:type IV pilus assembly protein PilE